MFQIRFNFMAYLSRNEKLAMDQVIKEIKNNFEDNFGATQAILDRTDKQTCRNVKYTDFSYETLIDTEVDILVSALWFDKYKEIPFKVTKGLVYWYHMAWVYSINEMVEFCNERNIV